MNNFRLEKYKLQLLAAISAQKSIILHVLAYGLILAGTLPLVFKNVSPGYDPYYIMYTIGRFVKDGVWSSGLSYSFEFTPLYYGFYIGILKLLKISPQIGVLVANYSDYFFGLLLVVIFELIIRKIQKRWEIPFFILMLFLVPVFWYVSLFSHPITISFLFFFISFYIFMQYFHAERSKQRNTLFIIALVCFISALLFRSDSVFMILLFPASLFTLRKESLKNFFTTGIFLFLGILGYTIARFFILGEIGYGEDITLLIHQGGYSVWSYGLEIFTYSIGIGGMLVFLISLIILAVKKDWRRIILPVSGIALVLAALFPSAIAIRRFYYIVPLIIMLAYFAFLSVGQEKNKQKLIAAFLSILVFFNFLIPAFLGKVEENFKARGRYFDAYKIRFLSYDIVKRQRREKARQEELREFSEELLLPFDKPVIVLADWNDIGAICYHFFRKDQVDKEYDFKEPDIDLFSHVIELKNGNKFFFNERAIPGGDSLEYFLAEGNVEKYEGYYLILLVRKQKEDMGSIKRYFQFIEIDENKYKDVVIVEY